MQGQYVAYTFYKLPPAWRRLPIEERAAAKEAFAEVIEEWSERLEHLHVYATIGVRPDCETPYAYLATTKASQYTSARRARKIAPRGSPYLVVYPFVKVRPWYALPEEDRQRAMDEHIATGASFPSIHNHTTYSFGIDDQEFMTAFECDEPADFMHLMLTLRESEASRYTERDTPIFVGHRKGIREVLHALDGATAQTRA
jgi:chlorite dismutase